MLYLAIDRIAPEVPSAETYEVCATIVAYSGQPLLAERLAVRWRPEGTGQRWSEVPLTRGEDGTFRALIPAGPSARTVEYFAIAADASGRTETAPRTAPNAVYRFTSRGR